MAVGIAERMLTVYKEMTKNRTRAYTLPSSGKEIPPIMRLAESTHQMAAARAFMEKTWDEHKALSEQKRYPTDKELAFWRTNQAYAIKMCCEAINHLFEVAGGSTWIHDNEIQPLWRDCNMTAAHAYTDYDV
jgi:alkylation response protein AidB-like acyl-CoA dehydrogenase